MARPNTLIDLRSDTVTRPTAAMQAAMAAAELGDDGLEGDPTVRRLEAMAAERTGKEAGLYVTSGTMGNLLALLTHAEGAAGSIVMEQTCHIMRVETGGVSVLAGLLPICIPGQHGAMPLDAVERAMRPKSVGGGFQTRLVSVETTHNVAGGFPLPLDHLAAIRAIADRHGVPVHIDGARIFNAAVAQKVGAAEIARHADSVTFCISKGLSAPVGSLLCGSRDFIARARPYRRMVGGNMRQSGVIAAAGIVALEQMIERLAEDHARASALAKGLHAIDPRFVDPALCPTNIVRMNTAHTGISAFDFADQLKAEGIWCGPYADDVIRFVTNRHIDEAAVTATIAAVERVFARAQAGRKSA